MNNMVIVFDIDGVLCWYPTFASRCTFKEDVVATLHPECPIIEFKDKYFCHTHVFIPYLDVLMQYLIDNGSRIAFFSAGTTMRNKTVIKRLLVELFGEELYMELLAKGHFQVFSAPDMRDAIDEEQDYQDKNFGRVKDLSVTLTEFDTIENTILIEDQPAYAAYDQKPCVVALQLEDIFLLEISNHFAKNATYYLLGIFSSYFEQYNAAADPLPNFKIWWENFLLSHSNPVHYKLNCYIPFKYDKLVEEMINIGLSEVQIFYPEAIFYDIDSLNSEHAIKLMENSLNLKPQLCI